jgi:hypothetical protein
MFLAVSPEVYMPVAMAKSIVEARGVVIAKAVLGDVSTVIDIHSPK